MYKVLYQTIFVSLFILLSIPVYAEANYYVDMQKIDRKIYVASTQQKMLKKTLQEKKKSFSRSRVRAYKKTIAKIHKEEMLYRNEKKHLQEKIWISEARERQFEKKIPSIPGDIYVHVNKSKQTMEVYKGKTLIYSWICSTGKPGYVTPRGHYHPYYTVKMHYSRKWDMSPMPYSTFYHKGFAIHGTNYTGWLGRPASHGCIRLSTRNAKKIYHLAKKYGHKRVHIHVA